MSGGGFISSMVSKADGGVGISQTAQFQPIPCIDWIIPGMCSFACKHCHPEPGVKAAKLKKMYYCVAGDDVASPCLYTLSTNAAIKIAKMLHRGTIRSGMRVSVIGDEVSVVDNACVEVYNGAVDPNSVRTFLMNCQMYPLPQEPQRLWCGPGFCGLGMIQYHDDQLPDQRDITAAKNGYSQDICREFMAADTAAKS